MGEKRLHFSLQMIARLFGVSPGKTGTLVRTLKSESVQNDKRLIATQKVSESYYPTRGVVTVGLLMTVVGLLLFSPINLPSIYRLVGGIGFFIMGVSVIGSGLLNSRKEKAKRVG